MLGEIWESIKKAVNSPAGANAVKRLRLGIRAQDADAWLPLMLWDAGCVDVDWADFAGAPCGLGLDLASSCDFAALSYCFPVGEDYSPAATFDRPWGYLFRWKFWLPKGYQTQQEKRLRELAAPWAGQWVELTEGDAIDTDFIEQSVIEIAREYDVRKLCYDPWNAGTIATHLQNEGIEVVKFEQSMRSFAEPAKRFEELAVTKRLKHDGNPCARWMANNVVLVTNGAGHKMPSRKKSRNKIDGIVAAVMALGAAMGPVEDNTISPRLVVL